MLAIRTSGPIRIAVSNFMPTKFDSQTQILRLLHNSPLKLDFTFIWMDTHESNNATEGHPHALVSADGLTLRGAPVQNRSKLQSIIG
jgi:homoserine O-succinyltransferase